jgi:hypothetical protein
MSPKTKTPSLRLGVCVANNAFDDYITTGNAQLLWSDSVQMETESSAFQQIWLLSIYQKGTWLK